MPIALTLALAAAVTMTTKAEQTGFQETGRYEETLQFCRRLEKESPWIRTTSFGTSPEGRQLILVIASKEGFLTASAAARSGKPVVLIQAGIHAGEIDGKDAGMMLLRDIAVTRKHAALLDKAIVLFMPIYNVDGHERFGPYNRINQNGPREMGWRTTSRNLNLNRDYMKADAVETRAWLGVYTSWWPDLTIDCHVTDGTDYRYDVTYGYESGPNTPAAVGKWIKETVDTQVVPALETWGHLPSLYIFLRDDAEPASGLVNLGVSTPRFSTGYTVLQNRPSFLVETHMLKDYRTRVMATYDTLRALLEAVNRDPEALRGAVAQADAAASAAAGKVPLQFKALTTPGKVPYKGVSYTRELSEVSGAIWIKYGKQPRDMTLDTFTGIEVTLAVDKPLAYIVPPQWHEVIDVLRAHGVKMQKLTREVTGSFDGYKLTEPAWQERPFEGRHPVKFTTTRLKGVERTFPAGSVVVPMDQRGSIVAANLLEPQGADSFASWGFFDSIMEQKEYAEAYVMEKVSRDMMARDPNLRAAFQAALADPNFAGSPTRRLDFFFQRSPWRDDRIGLYPVGLVTVPWDLPVEPL